MNWHNQQIQKQIYFWQAQLSVCGPKNGVDARLLCHKRSVLTQSDAAREYFLSATRLPEHGEKEKRSYLHKAKPGGPVTAN
ncbi:MAG: hypothetical protein KDE09_03875, partial [Anaerolineales bacterium]|nr:hypothetical protein [Anaerolineales bacterium]